MRRLNNSGDTIIEVVLSMALLTSVLFIAWAITNRATIIQRAARERVQMVNEVKEQAELIKSQWAADPDYFAATPTPPLNFGFGSVQPADANPCAGSSPSGISVDDASEWYLARSGATIEPVSGSKPVGGEDTKRVWVHKFDRAGFQEFYVRACWINNSGTTNKTESSQVILRLNT